MCVCVCVCVCVAFLYPIDLFSVRSQYHQYMTFPVKAKRKSVLDEVMFLAALK
jgi:hypothetical protein